MAYPNGAIPVTGQIGVSAQTDTYATHSDELGKGGHKTLSTLVDLYAVTEERRSFGMTATVSADGTASNNKMYILANTALGGVDDDLTNNNNWIELTTGGGGSGVLSVTGTQVDNTDPQNPIINLPNATGVIYGSSNPVLPDGNVAEALDEAGYLLQDLLNFVAVGGNRLLTGGFIRISEGSYISSADLSYYLDGDIISPIQTIVSLLAADPTDSRIDIAVGDENGIITIIEGTPDTTPTEPVTPVGYVKLGFFLVSAIEDYTSELLFDEGVNEVGGEWDYTLNNPGIELDTDDPSNGTTNISLSTSTGSKNIALNHSTGVSKDSFTHLSFKIKNTTTGSILVSISEDDGQSVTSASVNVVNGSYNYSTDPSIQNYQIVSIPFDAFSNNINNITNITEVRLYFGSTVIAVVDEIYLYKDDTQEEIPIVYDLQKVLDNGSTATITSNIVISSANLNIDNTSTFNVSNSSSATVDNGSSFSVIQGSTANVSQGSTFNMLSTSYINTSSAGAMYLSSYLFKIGQGASVENYDVAANYYGIGLTYGSYINMSSSEIDVTGGNYYIRLSSSETSLYNNSVGSLSITSANGISLLTSDNHGLEVDNGFVRLQANGNGVHIGDNTYNTAGIYLNYNGNSVNLNTESGTEQITFIANALQFSLTSTGALIDNGVGTMYLYTSSGDYISLNGGNLNISDSSHINIQGASAIELGSSASIAMNNGGVLSVTNGSNIEVSDTTITLRSGAGTTYNLPISQGLNGQVLTEDGSGNLSWTTISSGSSVTNTSELINDGADGTSTYVEHDELGAVATSNDYGDLNNTPIIPANTSDLLNDGDGTNPFATTDELGVSIEDVNGIEQFSGTTVRFEGFNFDAATNSVINAAFTANTYYVHATNGNDITGELGNREKPFQTLDAIFALYDLTTDHPLTTTFRAVLMTDGTYPIDTLIPNISFEIYSDFAATVDLSANPNANIFYSSNTAQKHVMYLNMPTGYLRNVRTGTSGGTLICSDNFNLINLRGITWDSTNSSFLGGSTFILGLTTLNSTARLTGLNSDVTIKSVTVPTNYAGTNGLFDGANTVRIGALVYNRTAGGIPISNNQKWIVGDISGSAPILFSYTYNSDKITIEFKNSIITNTGGIQFNNNHNGDHTFTGIIKSLNNMSGIIDSRSDRLARIRFIDFTCLDAQSWTLAMNSDTIDYSIMQVINSYINITGGTRFLDMSQGFGTLYLENSMIKCNGAISLIETIAASTVDIRINNLATDCDQIINQTDASVTFETFTTASGYRVLGDDGNYYKIHVNSSGVLTATAL